jgi:hypothetical protein
VWTLSCQASSVAESESVFRNHIPIATHQRKQTPADTTPLGYLRLDPDHQAETYHCDRLCNTRPITHTRDKLLDIRRCTPLHSHITLDKLDSTSASMAAEQRVTNQSNGTPKQPIKVEDEQTNENIFLFVPNLIGTSIAILGQAATSD